MTENFTGSSQGLDESESSPGALEEILKTNTIALQVCMDEAIRIEGDNIYVIGTPGSFVTTPEDNPGFPRAIKKVIEKVRPLFNRAVKKIGQHLGIKAIYTTSHVGCGALALQGVTGSEAVKSVSESFVSDNPDCPPFLTHIEHESQEVFTNELPEYPIGISINRPEDVHSHVARGVIFTTGGFINSQEFRALKSVVVDGAEVVVEPGKEVSEYKNYFVVSADWLAEALKSGASDEDLQQVMVFINDLTKKIMHNTLTHATKQEQPIPQLEIVIFDANRLGEQGRENTALLKKYLNLSSSK